MDEYQRNVVRILHERYPHLRKLPYQERWQQFIKENIREHEEYGRDGKDFTIISDGRGNVSNSVFEPLAQGSQYHIEGAPYPMRGLCRERDAYIIAQVKRIITLAMKFISGKEPFKLRWHQKARIWLAASLFSNFIIEFLHWSVSDTTWDKKYYVPPVAELHRLIRDERIRNIVCAILEVDPAYRYRVQHILTELNKENFAKDYWGEIQRLAKYAQQHEKSREGVSYRLQPAMKLAKWYLKLHPKSVRDLQEMVANLNQKEIALTEGDRYWANIQNNYSFT